MNVGLILLNNNTVTKDTSGQLVTTSLAIAEGIEVIHKNILELVRKYISDLTVLVGSRLKRNPLIQ